MVNVNEIYFDKEGCLHKITVRTANFVRYSISYNHVDWLAVCINFRIEEVISRITARELIPYTKANWVLYGKE